MEEAMLKRSSGVLMHISSLPGKFGIGTFGKEAYRFVDFLEETKQSYWQILPLTTTGYGDSPYQSFSAIAGNINFIDFDMLREEKLLLEEDYQNVFYGENREKVNYCAVYESRKLVLAKAVLHFQESEKWMAALEEFQRENRFWLEDFSEYMAIKSYFSNQALQDWKDEKIRKREKASLERSEEHTSELQSRQYLVCRLLLEKKKKITRLDKLIKIMRTEMIHNNAKCACIESLTVDNRVHVPCTTKIKMIH